MKQKVQQGINVVLKVDGTTVGGQQGVSLTRTSQSIDITNKINDEWRYNISGLKVWSLSCSGIYIVNSKGYSLLEDAFLNNKEIEVLITTSNDQYQGNAIITSFPLNSTYNDTFQYNITLLGNGALAKV